MISDQEIEDIKNMISVFPDAHKIAKTPDRTEKYKTGYIDKLKAAGVKCDVRRIYVQKL